MPHLRKRIAVAGLAVLVAGSFIGAGAVRAGAAQELLGCTASGQVDVAPNATATGFDWSINGTGSCVDLSFPLQNAKSVSFTGSGTSDTLGLCTTSPLVNNLDITVTLSLFDNVLHTTRTLSEHWSLALTTFPVATPFLVSQGANGAGTMLSHILLNCPPKGTDSGNFVWTQTEKLP